MSKHAKVIVRIISMGKFLKKDPTKELWIEIRIKLPYKVRHQLEGEEDGCGIFNGFKFVEYHNGEMHLHVGLVKDIKDDYKFEKGSVYINNIQRATIFQQLTTLPSFVRKQG